MDPETGEPHWDFNRLIGANPDWGLTEHEHELVPTDITGKPGSVCLECTRQHRMRLKELQKIGYAQHLGSLFFSMQGKLIRWKQFPDEPWSIGTVHDVNCKNVTLEIEDPSHFGGKGRKKWYRFGFSGILYDRVRLEPAGEPHEP